MKSLQLAQMLTRNLDCSSVLELSLKDRQSVVLALNTALNDYHRLLPGHLKRGKMGAVLQAPKSINYSGTNDVAGENYGVPILAAGRSFVLNGDAALNQFTSDYEGTEDTPAPQTLFPIKSPPAFGDVGAIGTVYGDVIRIPRRVSTVRSPFVVETNRFLHPENEVLRVPHYVGSPRSYRFEAIHPQAREYAASKAILSMNTLAMVLRVFPLPEQEYRVTFDVDYAPERLTLSDLTPENATEVAVDISLAESVVIPLAEKELSRTLLYKGDRRAALDAADEALARMELIPPDPDVGRRHEVLTPEGF